MLFLRTYSRSIGTVLAAILVMLAAVMPRAQAAPASATGVLPHSFSLTASHGAVLHPVLAHPWQIVRRYRPGIEYTGPRVLGASKYGDTADLAAWAGPIRDQGQNGSCATFSTTAVRYWLAKHDQGITLDANGFAPMFHYAQLVSSPNEGTSYEGNFDIETNQGDVPDKEYSYGAQAGLTDWQDKPQASDNARAAAWKITGYTTLYIGSQNGNARAEIEAAFAAGKPVMLGIAVYEPFMYAGSSYPILVQPGGQTLYGYHAVPAFKEDADGVWIANSWGTGWGQGGWVELSWDFIYEDSFGAYTMDGPAPNNISTPTPTATSAPIHLVTPTPTNTPMPTATPFPTSTPMPTPTHIPTSTPVPTSTSTPSPTATSTPSPTATPTPAPIAFDVRLWTEYTRRHHRPAIAYLDGKRRLTRIAAAWQAGHRRECGGAITPAMVNLATYSHVQIFEGCWASRHAVGDPSVVHFHRVAHPTR